MPISQSSRAMDTRSMEREHLVNMISNSMLFERIIHNKMFANIDIFKLIEWSRNFTFRPNIVHHMLHYSYILLLNTLYKTCFQSLCTSLNQHFTSVKETSAHFFDFFDNIIAAKNTSWNIPETLRQQIMMNNTPIPSCDYNQYINHVFPQVFDQPDWPHTVYFDWPLSRC